jgi:hypothetical protein
MLERRVEGGGPHTEWGSPPKGGFAPQKKNPKKIKFFPKNFFGESGSLKKCCRGGRTEGGAPQKFVSKKPSHKKLKTRFATLQSSHLVTTKYTFHNFTFLLITASYTATYAATKVAYTLLIQLLITFHNFTFLLITASSHSGICDHNK